MSVATGLISEIPCLPEARARRVGRRTVFPRAGLLALATICWAAPLFAQQQPGLLQPMQGLPAGTQLPESIRPGARLPASAPDAALPPAAPPSGVPAPPAPSRLDLLGVQAPACGPLAAGEMGRAQPETAKLSNYFQGAVDADQRVDVCLGRPRILVFRAPPKRIYQHDESIATHQIISEKEIALVGVKEGRTSISFWVADPQAPGGETIISLLVNVTPELQYRERLEEKYDALEKELNRAFPDSRVDLDLVGDQLLVRGQAKDALEARQILSVVARHRPNNQASEATLTAGEGVPQLLTRREAYAEGDRLVENSIQVSGTTAAGDNLGGIINLLQLPGEQQVTLRVTVAEVNRSALRSIGLNFDVRNDQGVSIFRNLTGSVAGLANLPVNLDNGQVSLAINALRTLKLARTLAEPNLTALNGHTAQFQAGGRFPVPVVGGFTNQGLQGVAFVPFGVQLQFTPSIVDRDRVRLAVNAEVSTRDEALGTSVGGNAAAGGTSVSGISSRNFETTVELREGQSLCVAGLIQSNYGADSDRVPFWGDLPLIGHTGGFNRVSSGEQELVIIVTPELVHPLEACHTPGVPGHDVFEPTDIEFFLGNKLESRRTRDYRASARTDYARIRAGDKYCEDQFIIGPSGPTYGCCAKNCDCRPNAGETLVPTPAVRTETLPQPIAAPPLPTRANTLLQVTDP